jgi:hypothetical protein
MIGSVYRKMRREGEGQPVVGRPHRPFFNTKISQFDGLLEPAVFPGRTAESLMKLGTEAITLVVVLGGQLQLPASLLLPDVDRSKYP